MSFERVLVVSFIKWGGHELSWNLTAGSPILQKRKLRLPGQFYPESPSIFSSESPGGRGHLVSSGICHHLQGLQLP